MDLKPSRRNGILFSLVIISLGTWFVLDDQGYNVPAMRYLWPCFIGLGAVASFVDFFLTKTTSSLGKGVFGTTLTATAFMLALGKFQWGDVVSWLPSIPFGAGLGIIVTCLVRERPSSRSWAVGIGFTLLGVITWLPNFPQIKEKLPEQQTLIAIVAIIAGSFLLIRQFKD